MGYYFMWKNIKKNFFVIKKSLYGDLPSRCFIQHNIKIWNGWKNRDTKNIILVEENDLPPSILSWSYIVNVLARKYDAKIYSYPLISKKISNKNLQRIYKSFNISEHINLNFDKDIQSKAEKIFIEIYPSIKTKQDLFNLKVLGIWIGIDIYSSYLRAGNPTVNLSDQKLVELIKYAIKLTVFWEKYFNKNTVKAVVISHDCYVYSNVLCKYATEQNVPVYLVGSSGGYKVDKQFKRGLIFKEYRKIFQNLSPDMQKNGIEFAKKRLERRFSGEVGVDMFYSKTSSFIAKERNYDVLDKNDKIKILICTHCFYDNPHISGDLLFVDFYEWLCFLGEISEKTDYDWYLKLHPDARPGTSEVIEEIIKRYPKIKIVPLDISHQELVKEGINFVLTVYGTVGCEYPLMDVQVINAGRNPHMAYNFNWHPNTVEEYENMLLNLDKLHLDINKDEVYEFYAVHHLHAKFFDFDDMIFKSQEDAVQSIGMDRIYTTDTYKYFLNEFNEERHNEIIKNTEECIDYMDKGYCTRTQYKKMESQ